MSSRKILKFTFLSSQYASGGGQGGEENTGSMVSFGCLKKIDSSDKRRTIVEKMQFATLGVALSHAEGNPVQ